MKKNIYIKNLLDLLNQSNTLDGSVYFKGKVNGKDFNFTVEDISLLTGYGDIEVVLSPIELKLVQ